MEVLVGAASPWRGAERGSLRDLVWTCPELATLRDKQNVGGFGFSGLWVSPWGEGRSHRQSTPRGQKPGANGARARDCRDRRRKGVSGSGTTIR